MENYTSTQLSRCNSVLTRTIFIIYKVHVHVHVLVVISSDVVWKI